MTEYKITAKGELSIEEKEEIARFLGSRGLSTEIVEARPTYSDRQEHRGELYQRIVDLSKVPTVPPGSGVTVPLEILNDSTIAINNRRKSPIRAHQLFIFNALLISRDKQLSLDDILELGFFPDGANPSSRRGAFTAVKNGFAHNYMYVPEIQSSLLKEGRIRGSVSKHYQLDPNITLVLSDSRQPSDT